MPTAIRHSLINSHCTDYSSDARRVMDDFRHNTPREVLTYVCTEFVSATDTEGSSYSAHFLIDNRIEAANVPADYSLTTVENHLAAAIALISREARDNSYELLGYDDLAETSDYLFTFRLV
jgi:hypothetical protein